MNCTNVKFLAHYSIDLLNHNARSISSVWFAAQINVRGGVLDMEAPTIFFLISIVKASTWKLCGVFFFYRRSCVGIFGECAFLFLFSLQWENDDGGTNITHSLNTNSHLQWTVIYLGDIYFCFTWSALYFLHE